MAERKEEEAQKLAQSALAAQSRSEDEMQAGGALGDSTNPASFQTEESRSSTEATEAIPRAISAVDARHLLQHRASSDVLEDPRDARFGHHFLQRSRRPGLRHTRSSAALESFHHRRATGRFRQRLRRQHRHSSSSQVDGHQRQSSAARLSVFDDGVSVASGDLSFGALGSHNDLLDGMKEDADVEAPTSDENRAGQITLEDAVCELDDLKHRFHLLSGESNVLNKPTFLYHFCQSTAPAEREDFFDFCKGHGAHMSPFTGQRMPEDQISLDEFMAHAVTMVNMTPCQRAKTVAALLTPESRVSAGLTKQIVGNILQAHLDATGLKISVGSFSQIVDILFHSLHLEREEGADLDAFAELFEQCTLQASTGDTIAISRSFSQLPGTGSAGALQAGRAGDRRAPKVTRPHGHLCHPSHAVGRFRRYLRKRLPWLTTLRFTWMTVYIIVMALAFVLKFLSYVDTPAFEVMGYGVCFARAFGLCAMINVMILYFAVCRKLLTMARNHPFLRLWKLIPFDDNIDVHRFTGHAVMICGFAHTIAHHAAFFKYTDGPDDLYEASPLGKSEHFPGPDPSYSELLRTLPGWTGVGMLSIMLIAYPATFFRRAAFNFFWYSHHLFIFVWTIFFVAHGKKSILELGTAVYWVCVPFSIFVLERLQRFFSPTNQTEILDAHTSTGSTVLYLRKPPSWEKKTFTAGTYAFLNVPEIARHEWHPFTLSSAPHDHFVRFHIRKAGDWTGKLHDLIEHIDHTSDDRDASSRVNQFRSFRLPPDALAQHREHHAPVGLEVDVDHWVEEDEEEERERPPSLVEIIRSAVGHTHHHGHHAGEGRAPQYHGGESKSNQSSPAHSRPRPPHHGTPSPGKRTIRRLSSTLAARLTHFGKAPPQRDPGTASRFPKVVIEGPISAPSDAYFRYKTSVLVAAGIGVTPMASILREVIYTWYGSDIRDGITAGGNLNTSVLQHVYFYWITRDQEALRWFADELTILSDMDAQNHMQIRIHLSSVKPQSGQLLRGVMDKVHESTGWDPISGVASKFRTEFGRPNWDDTFSSIALDHIGEDIGVFYCGPPVLEKMLQKQCTKHSIAQQKTSTRFILKSENF